MSAPLVLTLHPLVPYRAAPPNEERVLEYGYRLALPDGRLVDPRDPLLGALGAQVTSVIGGGLHESALQGDWIAPGVELELALEGRDEDGDALVGLWDREGVRCAGHLAPSSAEHAGALLELQLPIGALALSEERRCADDVRTSLELLLFPRASVEIDLSDTEAFARPPRSAPRRIVLCADGRGSLRAWDPAAEAGPADVEELPVSRELKDEIASLRVGVEPPEGGFGIDEIFARAEGEQRSLGLWRRAQRELGHRYAVGYLGPGMERPVWSPAELADEGDDEDEDF